MCHEQPNSLVESEHRIWKLIGRCSDCDTEFDLSTIFDHEHGEDEYDLSELPCQVTFANIGGRDVLVRTLVPPEIQPIILTAQGITPVRPCLGHLRIFWRRNPPLAAMTLPVRDQAAA